MLVIMSVVGLVVLAACGGRGTAPASDAAFQPEVVEPAASGSAAKLDAAMDFEFAPYGGAGFEGFETVRLSDLLGRPVVLNFWAVDCGPCRHEMPEFQEFYDEYGDKVSLFGLDVGPFTGLGSNERGRGFVKAMNITYPTGSTEDAAVVREYGVFSMPTTVFITAEGNVFRKWTGFLNKEKVIEIASDMLALSGEELGDARS